MRQTQRASIDPTNSGLENLNLGMRADGRSLK